MIWLVEVGRYRKVTPPVDDISVVFLKTVRQPASSLPNVHYRWTHWCTTSNKQHVQEKCPVMLTCPLGVVIVDGELTWGHVRQTVLLQGKVPGDWCGRFPGRLFLTSRSIRFLARLKAFNTLVSRESPPLLPSFFFACALFHVARAQVCHQARELILTNFSTVFSLVYPKEGSIAETSVKILT